MNATWTVPEISAREELTPPLRPELTTADASARRASLHPLAEALIRLAKLVSDAKVRWVGCRPEARQRIYFANHSSHLDFLVIWSALPKQLRTRLRPVGGRDYWTRSRVSRFLATKVFRMVLIERGCHAYLHNHHEVLDPAAVAIEPLVQALGISESLVVFPEGTRGDGVEIGPFRSGIYHLAKRKPDVELVPVYLENMSRILPKGEFLPVPAQSSVTFGPPLHFLADEPQKIFLERARAAVCALSPLRTI